MRIGIITICKINNYGAELQAFATQKKLEQLGHNAEIIDYLYYKNWRFKDTKLSMPFRPLSIVERLIYWLKYRLISFLVDIILPIFNGDLKRRQRNYKVFTDKNRFSQQYKSMDALYKAKHDYDLYMVGSDQVWNPCSLSSIEPYFLTFAPKEASKVAYASSFGISSIEDNLSERYAQLLNNITNISVREISGVELVRQLTGREVKLVIDPTLLLTKVEWEQYMRPVKEITTPFILVYQLLSSSSISEVALKIGQEKKIPVYNICKRAYGIKKHKGITNILDAGPSEFLWMIEHAVCLITDSFHGTAFSVNFATPFCCILNRNRKNNGRMISLLKNVGLNERIVYEDNIDRLDIDLICSGINNEKLDNLRNESVAFIKNALQ